LILFDDFKRSARFYVLVYEKYDTPAEPVEALTLHEPAEWTPSLELPEAPDFVSRPSHIPLDRMIPPTFQTGSRQSFFGVIRDLSMNRSADLRSGALRVESG